VLDRAGFAGLSIRAVARELDATTGIVTHYFPTKRELTSFALDLLAERTGSRERRGDAAAAAADPHGPDGLRSALLGMLALDDESRTANRIWVSSWDAALAEEHHASEHAERYRASRAKVAALVEAALGDADDEEIIRVAEALHSFALGMTVQAVIDPGSYPPDRQIALLDDVLGRYLRPQP